MSETVVVQYGGGVNSVAVCVLLARRGVVPKLILMADPGAEWPETHDYRESVMNPWLLAHGLPAVTVVSRMLEAAFRPRAELYDTLEESCLRNKTLPSAAYGFSGCSDKYKRTPALWHVERQPWAQEVWERDERIVKAIGYDLDEPGRIRREFGDPKEQARYVPWYPLYEARMTREDCEALIRSAGLSLPRKSACMWCLGGDTRVVTRDGIRAIRDLAGSEQELLVPTVGKHGGLGHRGGFQRVEVKSLGVQPLWTVRLRRGRETREIDATAEHRWFLQAASQWQPASVYERRTSELRPGDRLRTLRAAPPAKERLMPVAVAQGFVFGDGSRGHNDNRPASAVIYADHKDKALAKFFVPLKPQPTLRDGRAASYYYGFPRFWKDLPPIRESRAFLLSWLAGYFAADGTVSAQGYAAIYSAKREHMEFVQSVAAVCGVGYTAVSFRLRRGARNILAPLLTVGLRVADLPDWFFVIKHHRQRIQRAKKQNKYLLDRPWIVESVASAGIVDEVFCATVPGAGAFGLDQDLMTGNCPNNTLQDWIDVRAQQPAVFERALVMSRNAVIEQPDVVGLMRCNPHGQRQLHAWDGASGSRREMDQPCDCAL